MNSLYAFVAAFVSLISLDALWILIIAKKFYATQIGHLFREQVIWWPLVIFYLLYSFGIVYFVINSATDLKTVILKGALLGLIAYMTYDLVNYSTFSGFTLKVMAIDLFWGVFITTIASVVGFYLSKF